jgi:hypothetical protein
MTTAATPAAGGAGAAAGGMPSWLKWLLGGILGGTGVYGAGYDKFKESRGQGGIIDQIFGSPGGIERAQNFTPQQMSALEQALSGLTGPGGALEYYMNILGNNPEAFAALEAPMMRQFNEQIVPGLAERFSAVGGQRSSAFPQALSQAGADLSERLSAQRHQLRGQAASNLLNTGLGARPYENIYMQGSPGLLGYVAQGAGMAAGAGAFG